MRPRRAQAIVEVAVVLPLLLMLAFGGIAVGRLVQVRMALDAATREAARTTSLATMPRFGVRDDARARAAEAEGEAQGDRVARGYGLRDATIDVDTQNFGPDGWAIADGTYTLSLGDLPFMHRVFATVLHGRPGLRIHAHHEERIDRFRSFSP